MPQCQKDLSAWAEQGESRTSPEWTELPSIPLYMDQVILYLRETLGFFEQEDDAPLLTSSMINNYVKNGVLPHPNKKKYNRAHLGALMAVCMLKPVLSLQEIRTLLGEGELDEVFYEMFRQEQDTAVREACAAIKDRCSAQAELLRREALRMALHANAQRVAARRILEELAEQEASAKKKPADQGPPEEAAKKERKAEQKRA